MTESQDTVVNGWYLLAHDLFLEQINDLMEQVEELQDKNPASYMKKSATKRLLAIQKLIFEKIPQDPTLPEYRQGTTLGDDYKHWFRAKFFQQYRLFFRYHLESKIIVYAWVNDDDSKRAYGSKTDAYNVFKKMLHSGNPPDDWNKLLEETKQFKDTAAIRRGLGSFKGKIKIADDFDDYLEII